MGLPQVSPAARGKGEIARRLLRAILLAVVSLIGAFVVFLTAPGCARVAESRAESSLNKLLPGYLGPADKYTTRIRGDSVGAILRGRLESVHIEGDRVRIPKSVTLDKLTLDFDAVSIDTRAKQLRSIGAARFSARISEASLNRYLTIQRPDLPGLDITLDNGTASVAFRPAVLARYGIHDLTIPIQVEGSLVPTAGGTQLNFEPDAARVLMLPVPRLVVDYLAKSLNPAVDLTRLPLPVQVKYAEIHTDGLTLTGTIPPDAIIRASEGNGAH